LLHATYYKNNLIAPAHVPELLYLASYELLDAFSNNLKIFSDHFYFQRIFTQNIYF